MTNDEKPTEAVHGKPSASQRPTPGPGVPEASGESTAASLLPALTLPKGGGAVRGIGEKFSTNPVTGTGSLSIPLATSAGRAGFELALSLRYDSGAGNGPFGLGWQLSAPSIVRKTDKGLPRYFDGEVSDDFLLSGAEELVPAFTSGGGTAPDTLESGEHTVRRYRPRSEGLYARIERWTHRHTGDAHWRVTTHDNVLNIYGRSPNARVADPEHPARVFAWLLEETRDDRGNIARYLYKAEDASGVDTGLLSEASRFEISADGSRRFLATAQRYLKRIQYGNRAPVMDRNAPAPTRDEDWLFEVVLDYGEHDAASPTPAEARPWPARQDAFSSFRATFEVRTYRLCRRVLVFHRFEELGTTPCLVRSTDFDYGEGPSVTYLERATQAGYRLSADGAQYERATLPPLELGYARPAVHEELRTVDPASLEGLPGGIPGAGAQWVDLDGEGLPGALIPTPKAWLYKANLGDGRLAPPRLLRSLPSPAELATGTQQLTDLDGDGRLELVQYTLPLPGYFSRTPEDGWAPFMALRALPRIDWNDPNLRFIDLDGDGHADVLITEQDAFVWYRSLAKDGFEPEARIRKATAERRGPTVVFADGTESIHLADMSGDGMVDLVRVRNSEVCYWPNLGHGRFGRKVTLGGCPRLDAPDQFDPRRIRFADIDGSGTSDFVYAGRDGVRLYFNQAGNTLSEPTRLESLPAVDPLGSLSVVDLLGTGTACLVWSSPLPGSQARPLAYVDLMGGQKPHLLLRVVNNLGSETHISYAPSTKFYLADKATHRPWLTRLAFPVQVVERIEQLDQVAKTKLVTRFAYHHGYFDGYEREFRGFACVEQWDAEHLSSDGGPVGALDLPPVRTITWYHTGAWLERERLEWALAKEWYAEDPGAPLLPGSRLPLGLPPDEQREAARAMRGQPLRQEVYGLDGTANEARPYLITQSNFQVRCLQSRGGNRYGVFDVHPRETLTLHTERRLGDARVEHEFTLEVDLLGHVRRSAHLAYPRAGAGEPEQRRLLATCTRIELASPLGTATDFRHGVPTEHSRHELPLAAGSGLHSFEGVDAAMLGAVEVGFDVTPTAGQMRVLERRRHRYYRDDLSGPLGADASGTRALPYDQHALALPATLQASVFGALVPAGEYTGAAGYRSIAGDLWTGSSVTVYDPALFYQPVQLTDLFGNTTSVRYDRYGLHAVEQHSSDDPAFDSVTRAEIDYRTRAPWRLTDAHGNRNAVAFDALGMVVATASMGRDGAGEGDTLADPTTRIEYDVSRWHREGRPAFVHTFARERHGSANQRWLESYSYSDGSGRELLKKAQAEPGPGGEPRWVGTGRTVFDNKGNPVKQYEPYFSTTFEYEDDPALVMTGHTSLYHYDSLSRLVRTDFPDGTFATVTFDAWSETRADASDNVLESAWYADRIARPPGDPERRAAELAAAHSHTPAVHAVDPLGRTFLSIADNGSDGKYLTRIKLDIQGDHLEVVDARGVTVLRQTFDMSGHAIRVESSDAGVTINLFDGIDRPYRSWEGRGYAHRKRYDRLRRLTHVYVAPPSEPEFLAERLFYGEGLPGPNLRGRLIHHFDGAGVTTHEIYDFEGRITRSSRRLAVSYHAVPRWAPLDALTDPGAALTAASPLLETDVLTTLTDYDAMSRVERVVTPDGTAASFAYNEAALLDRVDVAVRGASPSRFVDNIDYNARGQRTQVTYGGGGVTATYEYDERSTMLVRVLASRASDGAALQDLRYTLDPAHNIVEVRDSARQQVFFNGGSTDGTQRFEYDALYRLMRAEGREHPGQVGYALGSNGYPEAPLAQLPHQNDLQTLLRYVQKYSYDKVGNIHEVKHSVPLSPGGGWTRAYEYAPDSNRLKWTSQPGDGTTGTHATRYHYDERGNLVAMPHLSSLKWDHDDRLASVDLGGGARAYYVYDSQGQRVRKVIETGGTSRERVYVGNFERYRERTGTTVTLERQTVHVYDGHRRLALVETDVTSAPSPGATRIRLQFANHLGTATVESTFDGVPISYEEYYPFGGSSFHSGDPDKRYRYTGKERDDETGFYYHGARYYAPWLGRWTSPDPAGLIDGTDVYSYVENNPIKLSDPTGLWEWPSARTVAVVAAVVVVGAVVTVATAGAAAPLVGAAVASIGLTGTAATVATGVVVGAVAGAAGGVASEVTRTGVGEGRLPTGRELGRAATIGAALGVVTGGAGAFASTARGVQAASTAARAVSRVPGAATAARVASTAGKAASAVARTPGVSHAVRATAAVARATGRGLGTIERAAGSAGIRAARGVFANSRATGFLDTFQATRSVTSAFGAARPSEPLRASADPAAELFGPGSQSHPEAWAEHTSTVRKMGAVIEERPGALAYMPSSTPGRAGTMYLDPDASLSALKHELQHLLDDAAHGFPGQAALLGNPSVRWAFERSAYATEIALARRMLGETTAAGTAATREQIQQLIGSLQQLRTGEWRRIFMPHLGR
ncbi:toxin [Corallococcus sp. CA054B]|uniref:SpvB/TcaC N-terminal domain-containing protein n=1 Tax=Corallococcus sp. CA054B TaxID=2316734 RepID=UPI000EA3742A|nr:SpvB/TcaC N-terminal domain-containing protein [Corallococcus sp. CA054B]RKG71640.1 toxin [Corallococcus sp. CA054B]